MDSSWNSADVEAGIALVLLFTLPCALFLLLHRYLSSFLRIRFPDDARAQRIAKASASFSEIVEPTLVGRPFSLTFF